MIFQNVIVRLRLEMSFFYSFRRDFANIDVWKKCGWNIVETIDGAGFKTWVQLKAQHSSENRSKFSSPCIGWPSHVLEMQNQELFSLNDQFVKRMKACSVTDEIVKVWDVQGSSHEKAGVVKKVIHSDKRFRSARAWNFPIDHLCDFALRQDLQLSAVDGLFENKRWFAEGHIEVCGYDSVSMTYFGQKIFVYAAGLEASRCLVKTIKTVESFIDMAQSGPPYGWQSKFSVCLPETKSLVV